MKNDNYTKSIFTSWKLWCVVAIVLAVMLFINTKGIGLSGILPYMLVLVCPLAMVFMMGGHKHK